MDDRLSPEDVRLLINSLKETGRLSPQHATDDLIGGVVMAESSGRPSVQSGAGAVGLMQLMPQLGQTMHKRLDIKEPYDPTSPAQNVQVGTAFLDHLVGRYGKLPIALAAYNAGEPRVDRAMKKAGSREWEEFKRFLAQETQEYPDRVLEKTELFKGQ